MDKQFLDNLPSSNGVPTGLKSAERERQRENEVLSQPHCYQAASEFWFLATIRRTETLPESARQQPAVSGSQESREELLYSLTHPKITAFQSMILFSDGAPLTPVGGSS